MIVNICKCVEAMNLDANIHKIDIHSNTITILLEHYNRTETIVYKKVKK